MVKRAFLDYPINLREMLETFWVWANKEENQSAKGIVVSIWQALELPQIEEPTRESLTSDQIKFLISLNNEKVFIMMTTIITDIILIKEAGIQIKNGKPVITKSFSIYHPN